MKKVLVIQHVPHEGPGIIKDAMRGGFEADFLRVYRDRFACCLDDYSALLVLGGPMGVYEEDRYPFIKDELRLIESALKKDVPILGVCLGSQLLAKAAGARVYKGGGKEIGWFDVRLTPAGAVDPLFLGLPSSFEVFQWHGDTFDVPAGAVNLASSELFPHQVIKVGKAAYGVQFHLEVTGDMINEWLSVNRDELVPLKGKIDPLAISKETLARLPGLHSRGRTVLSRFFRGVDALDGRLMCTCAQ
ncbi:MAG: gamma-glutamyl-gamma-aminobutyrate hydrolase family protein, partial [Deltaproteobacteria bacterium]|nr:gamma-glutamyl-gamma-aminobutyrate hydrolase family protein [Deltaproteobacteria bacterium]